MVKPYQQWIKRAESSLHLGMVEKPEEIFYEDLAFQLQQAAEKAFKALLIYNGEVPRKTHSIRQLILELDNILDVPDEIQNAVILEDYAVQTRYPGDYREVDKAEYEEALDISKKVLQWVKQNIQ
jgi:HEPN domain-containing protein